MGGTPDSPARESLTVARLMNQKVLPTNGRFKIIPHNVGMLAHFSGRVPSIIYMVIVRDP